MEFEPIDLVAATAIIVGVAALVVSLVSCAGRLTDGY